MNVAKTTKTFLRIVKCPTHQLFQLIFSCSDTVVAVDTVAVFAFPGSQHIILSEKKIGRSCGCLNCLKNNSFAAEMLLLQGNLVMHLIFSLSDIFPIICTLDCKYHENPKHL